MSTDERRTPAAVALAHGIAFATGTALVALLLPLATRRSADALVPIPLEPGPYLAGTILHFPLSVAIFALFALPFVDSARRSAGHVFTVVLSLVWLFLQAISYRWLGENGDLLHLQSVFTPLRAFEGQRALFAGLATALAGTIAIALSAALEPRLARRFEKKGVLAADSLLLGVAILFGMGASTFARGPLRAGVLEPAVALFLPAPPPPEALDEEDEALRDASGVELPPDDVLDIVRTFQGVRDPDALEDRAHPFCRDARVPTTPPRPPRSIVLLVLRGIGLESLTASPSALPSLAALASEGASFTNVVAGGDDVTQGLVQILSGVAPLAPTRYHELPRVPRLPSLPRALTTLGFDTAFVSARDLSPGRERTYLRDVGFGTIEEPSYAEESSRDAALDRDLETVERMIHRLEAPSTRPRLVVGALADLVYADPTMPVAAADAGVPAPTPLATIDAAIARLVAHWSAHERAQGTLLAIVGDSAPSVPGATDPLDAPRFHVPFVLANLRADELEVARARTGALAGLLDVADTLLGLEGVGAVDCFQGRDLLARTEPPEAGRRLVAFAGEEQGQSYVFDGRFRWEITREGIEGAFRVFDLQEDPRLTHDLYEATDTAVPSVHDQLLSTLGLGRYLATHDRYLPGERELVVSPLPTAHPTVQIATIVGAEREALARAREAGFEGFRLNVELDATLDPTVAGRPLAEVLAQLLPAAPSGTFVLDVALPDPPTPARSVEAGRRLVGALAGVPAGTTLLLFPRDPIMATSIAARAEHPVYARLPGHASELVDAAFGFGVDGIVFPSDSLAEPVLIRARHEGMRVAIDLAGATSPMTYTSDERPDYVLTTSETPATLP